MSEKHSFWGSLPDVLKYTAGIIGGLSAVLIALQQFGLFNGNDKSDPEIVSFEATKSTISAGQETSLVWVVNKAEKVSINGQSVNNSGNMSISPQATTKYVLAANNQYGFKARQCTITVIGSPSPLQQPPQIVQFNTNKAMISSGDPVTLSWNVKDADRVSLDGQTVSHTGEKIITPDKTQTYRLVANNNKGADEKTLTVAVKLPETTPDKKEIEFTRRALDSLKNNTWHGELVIFDPKDLKELAKGNLLFGPTTYANNIAYARISLQTSSLSQLSGNVEATRQVWGFMGVSTDDSISISFDKNPNSPIFVFNKILESTDSKRIFS
jgi:hypothetical protein